MENAYTRLTDEQFAVAAAAAPDSALEAERVKSRLTDEQFNTAVSAEPDFARSPAVEVLGRFAGRPAGTARGRRSGARAVEGNR